MFRPICGGIKRALNYKNLRLISTRRTLQRSQCLLQSVDFSTKTSLKEIDSTTSRTGAILSSNLYRDDPISHEVYQYNLDFKATCQDLQFVPEGGFIELTNAEMERYLPELQNSEMVKFFQKTKRNAFMIRDTTKLVCRFVLLACCLLLCCF